MLLPTCLLSLHHNSWKTGLVTQKQLQDVTFLSITRIPTLILTTFNSLITRNKNIMLIWVLTLREWIEESSAYAKMVLRTARRATKVFFTRRDKIKMEFTLLNLCLGILQFFLSLATCFYVWQSASVAICCLGLTTSLFWTWQSQIC